MTGEALSLPEANSSRAPRVGVWGLFDVNLVGEQARRRVLERELGRRLPGWEVRAYAPLGRDRPLAMDGGRAAEPLGGPSLERRAQLAAELDLVVVTGEVLASPEWFEELYGAGAVGLGAQRAGLLVDGLGHEHEAACPVVRFGVAVPAPISPDLAPRLDAALAGGATLLDEASLGGLRRAGVDVSGLRVLPDPSLLIDRGRREGQRRRRVDLLRLVGRLPAAGRAILVEDPPRLGTTDALVSALEGLLQRQTDLAVVLFGVGEPGGDAFETLSRDRFGDRLTRLAHHAGVEDVCAALGCASVLVAASRTGLALGLAMRAPVVVAGGEKGDLGIALASAAAIAPIDATSLEVTLTRVLESPVAPQVGDLEAVLDAELDRVADLARRVAVARGHHPPPYAARSDEAHDPTVLTEAQAVLQGRLVEERTLLQAEVSRLEKRLERVLASPEHRVSEPVRALYRGWRRRRLR